MTKRYYTVQSDSIQIQVIILDTMHNICRGFAAEIVIVVPILYLVHLKVKP